MRRSGYRHLPRSDKFPKIQEDSSLDSYQLLVVLNFYRKQLSELMMTYFLSIEHAVKWSNGVNKVEEGTVYMYLIWALMRKSERLSCEMTWNL